jgi:WD40 repeat protein
MLATGHEDGTVRLWDVATGKQTGVRLLHSGWLGPLAFLPDGKGLVSTSFDSKARRIEAKRWDLDTDTDRVVAGGPAATLTAAALTADGRVLAIAQPVGDSRGADQPDRVLLWDVGSGKELHRLDGHTKWVKALVFAPDGKTLASGSRDRTVRLWDVGSGKEQATLRGHAAEVRALAVSPNGRLLATGDEDGIVKLWDLPTGKERATFKAHPPMSQVTALVYSRDGKTLVSGSGDGTEKFWDVATLLRPTREVP